MSDFQGVRLFLDKDNGAVGGEACVYADKYPVRISADVMQGYEVAKKRMYVAGAPVPENYKVQKMDWTADPVAEGEDDRLKWNVMPVTLDARQMIVIASMQAEPRDRNEPCTYTPRKAYIFDPVANVALGELGQLAEVILQKKNRELRYLADCNASRGQPSVLSDMYKSAAAYQLSNQSYAAYKKADAELRCLVKITKERDMRIGLPEVLYQTNYELVLEDIAEKNKRKPRGHLQQIHDLVQRVIG